MKKTISISIGGYSFQVEEDAYEQLDKYLAGVKSQFASFAGAEEIVSDIEGRMAEQFAAKTGESRIITGPMVSELVAVMGSPEELGGGVPREVKTNPREGAGIPGRRFFRDLDNAMLGGVCSGIASYFGGVDPLWIRLAFALSIFFGGFGVVLYLILWMIVPAAKTDTEKMQMRGQAVNLKNLEQAVKERVEEVKSRDYQGLKKVFALPFLFLGAVLRACGKVLKNVFPILFRLVGFAVTVAAALAIAGMVVALVSVLFNANSPYVDFPVREVLSGALLYVGTLSAFFVAFIPLVFLMLLGTSLLAFRSTVTRMSGFSLLALWVVAVGVFAGVATRVAPAAESVYRESQNFEAETRSYDIRDFSEVKASDAVVVRISRGEDYKVTATGRAVNLDGVRARKDSDVLVLERENIFRFCIFCVNRRVNFEVTMPAIENVAASGAAQIFATGFSADSLQVKLSGASKMDAELDVKTLTAGLSGASRLTLGQGTYDSIELKSSGASYFSAADSDIKIADLDLSGASRAELGSLDELKVRASGASKVYYGSATELHQDLSGASKVVETLDTVDEQ